MSWYSWNTWQSPNGMIWAHIIPATPFSRSHHQKRFGRPDHCAVLIERPVAPPLSAKVSPQPWRSPATVGCSPVAEFVRSDFALGMYFSRRGGRLPIWSPNIFSTVSLFSSCFPVVGEVPLLRSIARISGQGR